MEQEDTEIGRRQFFKRMAVGATGVLSFMLNHTSTHPQDKFQDDESTPQAPRGTMMIIGGGYPPLDLPELQAKGDKLTADECDPLKHFRTMIEHCPRKPPVVTVITNASEKYAKISGQEKEIIFKKLGAKAVHVIDTHDRNRIKTDRKLIDKLRVSDIIYIGGGDQEILADLFLNTEAHKIMCERYALDENLVIGGSSAGAMIMANNMIRNNAKKEGEPTPVGGGFSLLNASVETHLNDRTREHRMLSAIEQKPDSIGIGLDYKTALLIKNGKASIHGPGRVMVACHNTSGITLDSGKKADLTKLAKCERYASKDLSAFMYKAGDTFDLGKFAIMPEETRVQNPRRDLAGRGR
jgi:cyanophycinase